MNIGVDIRCLMGSTRTGVGEYTFQLLNAIFAIDKINQYFLFYNSAKDVAKNIPHWKQENVHFVIKKWPNKLFNLLLWIGMIKLDQLIIHNTKFPIQKLDYFFSPNLNFTALTKLTKLILTIHDLSFEFLPDCFTWKQRLWHWFLQPRKQCQRANLILTPSGCTARDVMDSYKVCKVNKVIKLCPGVSHKLSAISHNSEKYILYLGTLEPRKNVGVLIEAYKKFCNSHSAAYNLLIVGDKGWKSKSVTRLIENTHRVEYVGYIDEARKVELYQNASLFVFPSLYEGFGLPVLEAMSAGVPVITSNRSSLPEVGGNAVYYVNPNNVLELAGAIKLVLSDEKLKLSMKEKGLEQAKKFNWQQAAAGFIGDCV